MLIEIEDGLNTKTPRSWRILVHFEEGEWKHHNFQPPTAIQPEKR
jgi:hypothetical protein